MQSGLAKSSSLHLRQISNTYFDFVIFYFTKKSDVVEYNFSNKYNLLNIIVFMLIKRNNNIKFY